MTYRPAVRTGIATLALALAALAAAPLHAQQARSAGPEPAAIAPLPDGMEIRQGSLRIRVLALSDDILRVTMAPGGALPEDASWAVPADVRARRVRVQAGPAGFATRALRVAVEDGRLVVSDLAGKPISADALDPVKLDGHAFTLRKQMPQAEHYYGLGDKTGGLDRRGKSFVDWNTDAYGFSSADDPIYKSIPFFIGVGGAGGSYGIFLDNTWRSWFDFGHREEDVLAFGAPGGPIDYYLIHGPTTAEVVRRYTDLTGRAPLVPRWALGYQQSRYSYMSAAELSGVVARMRAERVPLDVVWLDIDWQDRNRPFTVDRKAFPDMPGLVRDLGRQGVKLVTITDLHVAKAGGQGYAPYDTGVQGDRFVKNPDGSPYVAPVWPGDSVFPDFTQAAARDWWGGLFKEQVAWGVAGSWNDMNEPAIFNTPAKTMPLDTRHRIASDDFAPRVADHREIHNVYGMQNTRATYDGLRRLAPDERAMVMTRASYAGGQRYAVTWTGDNSATWDHLKLSIQQIINLGLSGFSYGAADVSGFAGGPGPDLLTRWFEIGAFYPLFRDHSAKGTPRVEPWVDGPEHLAIRRRFVQERYRLMPYLYALAEHNARTGDPILRPVFYDYPSASSLPCDQSWTFTLGRSLLVSPPPNPESPRGYRTCLPEGGWFDYWTGLPAGTPLAAAGGGAIQSATQATGEQRGGGSTVDETPRLAHLPVYVRAGTILPRQGVVQSTAETPAGPLLLDVYPGPDCRGELYVDDGHTMAFEKGAYLRQSVRCTVDGDGVAIAFGAREGRFAPWWRVVAVTVHGWLGKAAVRAGGRTPAGRLNAAAHTVRFTLDDPAQAGTVLVRRVDSSPSTRPARSATMAVTTATGAPR
jgi:alpha-glucosidase